MTWFEAVAVRVFLCVLVVISAFPQQGNAGSLLTSQFNHRAWTANDGAPGQVLALAQTRDGWLWLGSPNGLYRFDGVEFEQIDLKGLDPKHSKAISMLYASDSGGLWIGYVEGDVSLLKDGRFTHYGEAEGMGHNTVLSLTEDARGGVWMACANALWHYDGHQWERARNDRWKFPERYAIALFLDQRGTLWVAGEHEIYTLDQESQRFQPTGMKVGDAEGSSFIESADGRAWYANQSGLHGLSIQGALAPRDENSNARTSFATMVDRSGTVWWLGESKIKLLPLGDSQGEVIFKNYPEPEGFTTKDGLSSATTRAILEDREGNIWVGTSSGIDRFRPMKVHPLPSPVDEMGNRAIAPAENGAIWIGSKFGVAGASLDGLWKFDNGLDRIPIAGIAGITAVDIDTNGGLWVAGPAGVWRQKGLNQFEKFTELPEDTHGQDINALTIDPDGNPWASVVRSTLFHYRNGNWEREGKLAPPNQRPRMHIRDRQGRLWFGYNNGTLALLESGQVQTFGPAEGLDIGGIDALHVGVHTVAGSENGVAVFDDGRFHTVMTPADPTVLRGITGIAESKNGDLWLNGTKGAVRIAARDVDLASKNRTYEWRFELFDAGDGYPGMAQPIRPLPTLIEGSDGRLWFAGTQSIAFLDPSAMRLNEVPPPVVIRSLTADGHVYAEKDVSSLAAGTHELQIDYTALSLARPDRVRFRYRLDGFDPQWIEAGPRRQAFYTNLGPGRYHFRVTAANESGIWNDADAGLEIVIPPTFVQTKSFLALCIAGGALLLWLAYTLRVRTLTTRLRSRLEERLAERERIARELHDTLLQSVQALILKFQNVAADAPLHSPERNRMEEALDRADGVLAEGRERVTTLRVQSLVAADLPQAIRSFGEELMNDSCPFIVSIEGTPRVLTPIVYEEVLRIAREAVTNSYRHAKATKVETEILYHRAELRLRFRDNGCGIGSEILAKGRPGHWGMLGMRERAGKIRASWEVWSRPETGTEIELRVPARIAYLRSSRHRSWWRRDGADGEQ